MRCPAAQSVSPVNTPPSFATQQISPEPTFPASSCLPAFIHISFPSFSSFPVRELISFISEVISPEITFINESFPTNGSATVLNTRAAARPLGSQFSLPSVPSFLMSYSAAAALGASCGNNSIIISTAAPVWLIPQKTGQTLPSAIPFASAEVISASLNCSPSKYFSISASSDDAAASIITVRIFSMSAFSGTGISVRLVPSYLYALFLIRSTNPKTESPSSMGTTTGQITAP